MTVDRRDVATGTTRRDLVKTALVVGAATAASGAARSAVSDPPFELAEATVADLQQAMAEGRHTASSLTAAYLARIAAVDGELKAVIELNPEAAAIAAERDRERAAGRVRGPLHGIPVMVKDNVATTDRMQTTAGSLALVGARPPRDAAVVERLRAAGAVLLAKTNLSEWANFRSTRSTSGWSGRGGQCRNPYALDRSPCGSSSGSGVAVAANLAALAVGTETDGSIVCPAAVNGVVGIKPTLGLVSRSGIVPLAHSQDTAGPMARTVAAAAVLLAALAGPDPADPITAEGTGRLATSLLAAATPGRLDGFRVGVVRALFGYSPAADRVADEAIGVLTGLGATVVDPVVIPHLGEYDAAEYEVLLYEFKHDLDAYLAELVGETVPRSLAELIAFNLAHAERELAWFGQEVFEAAAGKGPLTDPAYLDALATCRTLAQEQGLDAVLAEHRLDALFAPTGGPAWTVDPVNGDHYLGSCSTPAAVAGTPHVTVPAGFVHGLPLGVSLFGRAWSEPTLIRLAAAFEAATRARRPPRLLRTVDPF